MPNVRTNSCGIPKIRSTLNNTWCLVVRIINAHNDTEDRTRIKKKLALIIPSLVIANGMPNTPKLNTGSPGLNISKRAGRAMKRAKTGMNTQVRFRKKPMRIEEITARKRVSAYMPIIKTMLRENKTAKIQDNRINTLNRASRACRNPFLEAYSSENIDSSRKYRAPINERSIKLLLLNISSAFFLQ